ncbi:MAG TPA: spore coat protein GerQ [Pseudogracilibacillus sp.]|nr:spore coat protein GerQ [Pseudogracilibacillus sp.]
MYYQPYEQCPPYAYKGMVPPIPPQQPMMPPQGNMPIPPMNSNDGIVNGGELDQLPMEQSYIENILRLNRGKMASVFMSFDGDVEEFRGIVEAAGRDHIIVSDPETGKRYLLLMVYLNYIVFDEEIEYSYPFDQLETYAPR